MLPSVKTLDLFKNVKSGNKRNEEEENETNLDLPKRQRTFASVRNQFVVHVFVPLVDHEQIKEIYGDFADITFKVKFYTQPHISFIRGHYAVQYHQIDPLLAQLTSTIKSYQQFSLCLCNVQLFNNDEKLRYFIAICEAHKEASSGDDTDSPTDSTDLIADPPTSKSSRHDLIESIHSVLKQYRSEVISIEDEKIDNFIYHTSVAWFLSQDEEIGRRLTDQVTEHFAENVILTRVNQVHIKIGHRSAIVDLM